MFKNVFRMLIFFHGKTSFVLCCDFLKRDPHCRTRTSFQSQLYSLMIFVSVLTAFISHTLSREKVLFVFKSVLPPLRNKVVLDISSRLGAVMYGVRISHVVKGKT